MKQQRIKDAFHFLTLSFFPSLPTLCRRGEGGTSRRASVSLRGVAGGGRLTNRSARLLAVSRYFHTGAGNDMKSSRQVGSCACMSVFRRHKYSCLSSLAVGSPYFCWHMVDGLELEWGVWLLKCACMSEFISVFDRSVFFYTDTQFTWWPLQTWQLLRECHDGRVYQFVNWHIKVAHQLSSHLPTTSM